MNENELCFDIITQSRTWRTFACSILWITFAIVLTFAFGFAFFAVLTIGARILAQWSGETSFTSALAGYMMAFSTVFASTRLRTIQSIHAIWTFKLTALASVTFGALTLPIKLITNAVMLTLALVRTIPTPMTDWTIYFDVDIV